MNSVLALLLLYVFVISLLLGSMGLVCAILWKFTDIAEEDENV